ncbi:MAG: hypothetical protein KBH14_09920 [Vicinamibacteria bacterium]|nr:hypothetical protein [Vicinamibacteria bacterium]
MATVALGLSALLVLSLPALAQDDSQQAYRVGDRVELHISGAHWQQCVVTENTPGGLMRGRCDEYVERAPGTYRRAGGIYILYKGDLRPYGTAAPSSGGLTPATVPPQTSPRPPLDLVPEDSDSRYKVGDRVHIEASNHWVPCVVVENSPPSIMRVHCEAYPKLSRAAGVYTVDRDNEAAVRPASAGPTGPIAPKTPPRQAEPSGATGLKIGEYACYGSGGRILAGFGFRVLSGNRFTDLEGGNAGSYSVNGSTVVFRGGHLGGQTGRDLRNYNFRIGAQATCEPF